MRNRVETWRLCSSNDRKFRSEIHHTVVRDLKSSRRQSHIKQFSISSYSNFARSKREGKRNWAGRFVVFGRRRYGRLIAPEMIYFGRLQLSRVQCVCGEAFYMRCVCAVQRLDDDEELGIFGLFNRVVWLKVYPITLRELEHASVCIIYRVKRGVYISDESARHNDAVFFGVTARVNCI